jgi:amino acid transporter
MRTHSWDQRRDLVVRLLARLSLVAVLALLGALFVGGAATSQASQTDVAADATSGPPHQITLAEADPVVLVVGAVVIGTGFVVLLIGAFRPPTRRERRAYADVSNR